MGVSPKTSRHSFFIAVNGSGSSVTPCQVMPSTCIVPPSAMAPPLGVHFLRVGRPNQGNNNGLRQCAAMSPELSARLVGRGLVRSARAGPDRHRGIRDPLEQPTHLGSFVTKFPDWENGCLARWFYAPSTLKPGRFLNRVHKFDSCRGHAVIGRISPRQYVASSLSSREGGRRGFESEFPRDGT